MGNILRIAARNLKRPEFARTQRTPANMLLPEMPVEQLQHFELGARDAGVVDEIDVAQGAETLLEFRRLHALAGRPAFAEIRDPFDVQVKHVEPGPVRRAIGARFTRSSGKEGVQRVHAYNASAGTSGVFRQRCQVAEIAHAPIAAGAHRVELDRRSPDSPAVGQVMRLIAPRWTDYQSHRCDRRLRSGLQQAE